MRLFKSPNFNFIGKKNIAFIISGALILVSIISFFYNPARPYFGPNLSIDFTGGTLIQLKFKEPVIGDLDKIRSIITDLNLGTPEIKTLGSEGDEIQLVVKKKEEGTEVGDRIKNALVQNYGEGSFELRREEKVGPKIGNELKQKAIFAVIISLVIIVIYIGMRFHFPFGVASIIALFHDVLITVGVFSIFNLEISLPIIAALLTIVGYSLNDTIVVFDRIRENMSGKMNRASFEDKVNASINQCLSRTIITSFTTFIVVLTILIFFFKTGAVIEYFSIALLSGVVVGTYSSIFIASPVLVLWNKKWPIKK